MTQPLTIDTETFYAGVLYALGETQDHREFVADGDRFHQAFLRAVQCARQHGEVRVEDLEWMEMDPVYGVMHHADEMLAFGQSARMLSLLNPELVKARIRYSSDRARQKLEQLGQGHDEWFRVVAKAFVEALSAKP